MAIISSKKCIGPCGLNKPLEDFKLLKNNKYKNICKQCVSEYMVDYYLNNKEKISEYKKKYSKENNHIIKNYQITHKEEIAKQKKIWAENNKEKISEYMKIFREENKDQISISSKKYRKENKERLAILTQKYQEENKEKISEYEKKYRKEKKKRNLAYKMRVYFSSKIWKILKYNNSSKEGRSILEYLGYSFEEAVQHLENQFEWWMSRENQGVYRKKDWDDNDPSTWKWQVDHIIPLSDLPFTSMEDENFKIAWELSNLRPYSAKQNVLDGASKIRHKIKINKKE